MSATPQQQQLARLRKRAVLLFILFGIAVTLTAGAMYRVLATYVEEKHKAHLRSIVDIRVEQIGGWLRERQGDARTLTDDAVFLQQMAAWRQGRQTDAMRSQILSRLGAMRAAYHYYTISVIAADGRTLLSVGKARDNGEPDRLLSKKAMDSGTIVLSGLHKDAAQERWEIDLAAPLNAQNPAQAGVVYFHIDPDSQMLPFLWKGQDDSDRGIDIGLVQQAGDKVLFLNKLQQKQRGPFAFPLPLDTPNLVAAAAVRGVAGSIKGVDYQGTPVLAELRQIPGTLWYLVVQEKAAVVRNQVVLVALVFAGLGMVFLGGGYCTLRLAMQRKRTETEMRIAATVFESNEPMAITDANTIVLRVNGAFAECTGYTAGEVVGYKLTLLTPVRQDAAFYAAMRESIHRTGSWQGEIWDRRKNGEIYPVWAIITAVKNADGVVINYVVTYSDITMRKMEEANIRQLAFYDPLTRLPNRRLLHDRMQQALANSARSKKYGVLFFIDLDNFKTLNDTLGHEMGDLLLQQVAGRLAACVREHDTVARLGGDEFVVMLEEVSEKSSEAAIQAEAAGEKILATLNQPYQLASHVYRSTPSLGATLFRGHDSTIDELLRRADSAMYQAKTAGRNALRFFTSTGDDG